MDWENCRKGKGRFLLAFLSLVTAFSLAIGTGLATSAETPKKGGTLTLGLNTDLTNPDPHLTVAVVDAIVLSHVFEPLLGYTDDLDIQPVVAESWKASPDYKTFTFNLIKGKTFHNGREMTSEDVKFSLERVADPNTKSPRQGNFKDMDRIETPDKYTVVIHLRKSTPEFPHSLADLYPIIAIVPKEELEKQGGTFKHPVGTGPFKFVEWKPDRHVILERFPHYKGQSSPRSGMCGERVAYVDKVKIVALPEESVAVMALLNKEIDILQYFPPKYVEKYKTEYAKKGLDLQEVTGLSWYQIWLNVTKPPLNNVKFRQALAYAIDLDMVTYAAYLGHAKSNPSILPPGTRFWTPYHKTWYKKDVGKAKQLLKEAGYNGEEIVLDTTKKYASMYAQAVAVQSELVAAGVNVKLDVMEWPTLLKRNVGGEFQMSSYGMGPSPNPGAAYEYLRRSKIETVTPRILEIVEASKKTADTNKLKALFEEAHKIMYEQVPMIELYNYNYLQAHWNHVGGYKTINTGYPRAWGVWLKTK